MSISVKLEVFEGPLDLLLHLIDKNKVNIYDIPVAEITDQYMEYVTAMKTENLDVMSEFLVMAATLLEIKARMLLPPEKTEEGELLDPRAELVQKLLEYKMYKYISNELREKQEQAAGSYFRSTMLPEEVKAYRQPVHMEELLGNLTLARMHQIYQEILKRQENRIDPIRSKFGTLEKQEINLNETMQFVSDYIIKKGSCTFRNLLMLRKGKVYMVVAFLTILEMMKEGKARAEQETAFGEIYLVSQSG